MLREGLTWKVGNGTEISMWRDNWIPNWEPTVSPSSNSWIVAKLRVCELIDQGSSQWNEASVRGGFDDEVASKVLNPIEFLPKA